MIYELRFRDGTAQTVDAEQALSDEQLAALNEGRAKLVAVDKCGNVAVLAEVNLKGELMVIAEEAPATKGTRP